jgi:RHH-type proline utilization regulon transcriptional repressor/proline dehydrogenase/delta 1-pyrroline-5-carboxylate dehydrogenase
MSIQAAADYEAQARIAASYRTPEPLCVPPLIEAARIGPALSTRIEGLARNLVQHVRHERAQGFGVEALMQEFSLSSREGVALMCLAESLLRIPDAETRDLLIRDKLSQGDWNAHAGTSPSWLVNASAWGLLITGKLLSTHGERGLTAALKRAVARGGEPLIRKAMEFAMRLLGRQFVTGQTIEEALEHARAFEARGFTYSFDMLGEAAITAADAERYTAAYAQAIRAIGLANKGSSLHEAAGISVKLSALHPRYGYQQLGPIWNELYERLLGLAVSARTHGISFNIDAEEADRLDPSLALLQALAKDSGLKGWNGLGFAVQAYQKRAPAVIDYLVTLAEDTKRRLMVRLVKGAYWDSEIKRAQVEGLDGYPVFTRKAYTDVCYLACAKQLLARRDAIFPQFATHNAHTLAAIYHLAGPDFKPGDYEFQCLHGMGEALYGQVIGRDRLDRPCRIYAPVGTYETLLAYLVRRLLENGANSSFVHRLADKDVPLQDLLADPVVEAAGYGGAPHPAIELPQELFGGERRNSRGADLPDAATRDRFAKAIANLTPIEAAPIIAAKSAPAGEVSPIRNPAKTAEIAGSISWAADTDIESAMAAAEKASEGWSRVPASRRAASLERAAGLLEEAMEPLCALLVREAGRTIPNAVSEVREAVDFCRYYAAESKKLDNSHVPLGPAVCISPWNFPLAIFTGQVAAALAAGNPVVAKPAEQTPLIAAEAVRLLHAAGVPDDVLQMLPGDGRTGAALIADPRTKAVLFTGSTAVARSIQKQLAERGNIPFIAETGGQNAMIVDSSALLEQAVGDIVTSAFDSAGQRCSSLRVLCVQDGIADKLLEMLKGAMAEMRIGDPSSFETDIGPVIGQDAKTALDAYVDANKSRILFQARLQPSCEEGTFVAPTLLEINSIGELKNEIFGPILHFVRFERSRLAQLADEINATGFGLTFGVHSRIDETADFLAKRVSAGNIYINRNMVGAVVGVQPFGGEGLSGTGPKAGGPLYLHRLMRAGKPPLIGGVRDDRKLTLLDAFTAWTRSGASGLLSGSEMDVLTGFLTSYRENTPYSREIQLPSPAGEENRLLFLPRGRVLGIASTPADALHQFGAALATGNQFILAHADGLGALREGIPDAFRQRIEFADHWLDQDFDAVLLSGQSKLDAILYALAERSGPIIPIECGERDFPLFRLVKEKTISVNTAAAGGNASLMTIGR